jgi:hypothetical protein
MMKIMILSVSLCLSAYSFAAPAVLFDDVVVDKIQSYPIPDAQKSMKSSRTPESQITPLSQRSTLKSVYDGQEFESTWDLRSKRRVGVGALTSGATGLLGALLELNLNPSNSAIIGFGGGPGYNAFNFQWKYVFAGQHFSPYLGIGYARWYNAASEGNRIGRTNPAVLESKFLSEKQRQTGEFEVDLLTPTLGLQYNFLVGDYKGLGVFGEIVLLTQVSNLSPAPVGAFGAVYYF